MTILAPRSLRSAMMALLSKALSAIKPLKGETVDERSDADRIETMAGQENEAHEIAECVGQRQDFGRHAAFGAADGLALSPPFAPCPWRWTLTMVASTMAYSMSGSSEQASKSLDENIGFDPVAVALEDSVPVAEERPEDHATGFPSARSKAPLRQSGGCRFRCARGPSAYPDNAAPSSPIGRPSVRIVPSEA